MGRTVTFPVNGSTARGYMARPGDGRGSGPGVIVLQEWWGVVPQLKGVCDLLSKEGFTAFAPDLYHGDIAEHTEFDKASQLMMDLTPEQATKDMQAAVDFLLDHPACTSNTLGVVGFCMGGMLAMGLAAISGEKVAAAAPFYGVPLSQTYIDWENLHAKIEGHLASVDDFFPPEDCEALAEKLRDMGKDVRFHIYERTGHGFGNWENPLGTYNEQAWNTAWARTLELLRTNVS